MANEVDISERWLLAVCPKALSALLADHTTGQNIYWATDSYRHRGEGFSYFDPITIDSIRHDDVIRPRVSKSAEEQTRRVKEKAEVFTPAWICNAQCNLIDEAWFGIPEVFNREFVDSDGRHTWEPTRRYLTSFGPAKSRLRRSWIQYVNDPRLEITCGEAPYLISRYDAVSGEEITVDRRIGIFDRKMQVINAFEPDPTKWMRRVHDAIKATYGFEWQGDSLLLAREAMLLTIFDYYFDRYPEERPAEDAGYAVEGKVINRQTFSRFINQAAYFISWNLWQMDGLRHVLPATSDEAFIPTRSQIFSDELDINPEKVRQYAPEILHALREGRKPHHEAGMPSGIPAVICDWHHRPDEPRKIFFASLLKNDNNSQ